MPKKANKIGAWAFLIGVILAVIFGIVATSAAGGMWVGWVLVVIGIIIGLLNIADAETQPFLLAGAILVIVSYFGGNVLSAEKLGTGFIQSILNNMLVLFVPATIIVALKSVFGMAKG